MVRSDTKVGKGGKGDEEASIFGWHGMASRFIYFLQWAVDIGGALTI
jgi:hypothetical protein